MAGCGGLDFDDYVASRDGATSDAKPTCAGHDEDGDGVGDVCDPFPDMPGDRLAVSHIPGARP